MRKQKLHKRPMYSRNYQNATQRGRHSAPVGYGNTEELRTSLLIPPEYRGEFLRRQPVSNANDGERRAQEVRSYEAAAPKRSYDPIAQVNPTRVDEKRTADVRHGLEDDTVRENSFSRGDGDFEDVREAEEAPYHAPAHKAGGGGLISELSSLLFGRGGEEDALLILGIGLLLINSRMERGKTPLFSGGQFYPEEDDIGLFLILLLLFS